MRMSKVSWISFKERSKYKKDLIYQILCYKLSIRKDEEEAI